MGLHLAVSLMILGRPLTWRTLAAAAALAAAATLSAGMAAAASYLFRKCPWTARYAGSLLLLIAGTGAFSSLFLAIEMAWRFGHLTDVPFHILILILGTLGIAALYYFLAIAGFLVLPIGLLLIFAAAAIISRRPR